MIFFMLTSCSFGKQIHCQLKSDIICPVFMTLGGKTAKYRTITYSSGQAVVKAGQLAQALADFGGQRSGSQFPVPVAGALARRIHAETLAVAQNILNRENSQAGNRLHGQADELPVKFIAMRQRSDNPGYTAWSGRWFPGRKTSRCWCCCHGSRYKPGSWCW